MRRCVGVFEILAVGWAALLVAGARAPYAVAVSLAVLVALACVRPFVVVWRTCVPAAPRGWWSRFTAARRSDGTFWGLLVVVFWTTAAVGAVAGDVFAVVLGLVSGLLAWGAMWVLVRRLLRDRSAGWAGAADR